MTTAPFPVSRGASLRTKVSSPFLGAGGAPLAASAFDAPVHEHGFVSLRVEGALPRELDGTLYRNGPTVFDVGTTKHLFDGNGAITAVRLRDGLAEGAVQVVRAPTADADAGKRRGRYASWSQPVGLGQFVRSLFGAPFIRNSASINVLPWQGRLFAMAESMPPVEIDPATLATLGETDLDGVVLGAWNAHPHRVAKRRTTYQFGMRVKPTSSRAWLDVYALPDVGAPSRLTTIPLPHMMEIHDFFVTERHVVFALVPVMADPMLLLRTRGAFGESLRWHPERGTELLVVPIDAPGDVVRIPTESFFFWHSVNAFETTDGKLVLDLVRYPDFASQTAWIDDIARGGAESPHEGAYFRAEVDLSARSVRWEERWPSAVEFPMVHPDFAGRAHRYAWLSGFSAGRGMPDRVVRFDVESGRALAFDPGVRGIVSEPVLVPKHGATTELDAWVLVLVGDMDANAGHLAVWDAARPEDGPLARAWFDHPFGPSLHGAWVPRT